MTDQELTKLIAEKVMGWELGQGPWYTRQGEPMFVVNAFRPLVNDSPAFMVVDKMIEKGFTFSLIFSGYASKSWNATFYGVDEYSEQLVYDATHESRRRAICIAALRAVGEVVE